MAQSTYGTYLLMWNGTAYEKVTDIIDFSDIGSTPNMIDVSDLSFDWQQQIFGNKQLGDGITFTIHVDMVNKADEFKKLVALEQDRKIREFVVLPINAPLSTITDMSLASYTSPVVAFYGMVSLTINGGGVDEELRGTLTIALQHVDVVDGSNKGIEDLIAHTVPKAHLAAQAKA